MKLISQILINFSLIHILFSISIFAQINFTEYLIHSNTDGLGSIQISDLDNDSDMDVVGASLRDDQIIWWQNEGGNPIKWMKYIIGDNVGEAHSVSVGDFNGDGLKDVIGAAYTGFPGIALWINNGGSPIKWTKFAVSNNFFNAHEISAFDIDNDNDLDILGASSDLNRIAWWRNDGGDPIQWTEQILSSNITKAKSVTAGDLDGDGDNDIIGASILDHDIIWWRNDGGNPIKWTKQTVDNNFIGAHYLQAVDIDNDTDLDVLSAGYLGHEIAWWKNNGGNPIKWEKQIVEFGFTNACVAYAADLDNDGDKDIVATSQGRNQIAWWRNDGGNPIRWTKSIIKSNFSRPWPVHVGDLDGDQDADIVVGSSHNGNKQIKWWANDFVTNISRPNLKENRFGFIQNYPNPFNPNTKIKFSLKTSDIVTINIYNNSGELIEQLLNENLEKGIHEINFNARTISSGVYYYQLLGKSHSLINRMILIK